MLQCAKCRFGNCEVKNKIIIYEAGNLYLQMFVEYRIDINKYLEKGDITHVPLQNFK